jgi:Bacterial PH domain
VTLRSFRRKETVQKLKAFLQTAERSIRLFASNWIFGLTLGLWYNKKIGTFFVYMTDPRRRLDIETRRGVLVISPRDKAAVAAALSNGIKASS